MARQASGQEPRERDPLRGTVCLDGTFACTQAFFEDIRGADEGRLINISSVIGKQGNYGQANYAAAKSGLFADIEEIASLVRYLASTESAYMTGEVINLNGGLHL